MIILNISLLCFILKMNIGNRPLCCAWDCLRAPLLWLSHGRQAIFAPQFEDAAAMKTEGNALHALATGSGKGKAGLEQASRMKCLYMSVCVCVCTGHSSLHLFS